MYDMHHIMMAWAHIDTDVGRGHMYHTIAFSVYQDSVVSRTFLGLHGRREQCVVSSEGERVKM